jgi:iron complex outermembrane receptor protein
MARHHPVIITTVILVAAGLSHAAELAGRVVSASGQPLAGAQVTVSAAGYPLSAVTDATGRFDLGTLDDVPLPLELVITAPGHLEGRVTIKDPGRFMLVQLEPSTMFSGEVEVTGTRATVGETPVTVTNVTGEEIERGYWGQDAPMFLTQVPGFYAYNDNGHGIGYSYFFLRGFDMRRIAVSLNGVPLNDAHSHSVFFVDLADFLSTTGDIQVQRGVGTNLYGGSAIGGSVDLRVRSPLPERRLRVSAMGGSWGTSRFSLEYDTGLWNDEWAATFRWSKIVSDGYRDQSWTEMWNYHLAIERLGERSLLRLLLFGGPEDTHLAYLGVPRAYLDGEITGDRRRDRRHNPLTYPNEVDHFFQPHYQLIHSVDLSDAVTLQNTVYYFSGDGYFRQFKEDRWMPEYNLPPFEGPDGEIVDTTDLVRKRSVSEWDAGWIPFLEWRHGGGRGTAQAGVALRYHDGRHFGETVWAESYPPGLAPDQRYYDYRLAKTTIQPFVQETWRFSERWSLLAGLTWTSHRYEMDEDQRKGREVSASFDYLLPRLGVTFSPDRHWSLYGNVSRGGREPAFRDIYDAQDYFFGEPLDLEPEELTDYELGGRYSFEQGYAQLNLFFMDFDNAIVFAGSIDSDGVPVTANGARTENRGAELELAWTPRPRWGARFSLAYSDHTFTEFVEYDWDGNPVDQSGNRVAVSPDWLGSLELTGGVGPVDARLALRHVGQFFLDNTENQRKHPEEREQPGYVDRVNDAFTVADLALRVDLGRRVAELVAARSLMLDVRVNNLFDELYTTFGYTDWPEPVWIPAATRSTYVGIVADW